MPECLSDSVKLVPEVYTYKFDTSLVEKSYILCVGMKRFEISEGIYQLIKLIDGKKSLSEIASEYSEIRNKIYTTEDICAIIHSFLNPCGILENTKSDDNIPTSNSYLYFQYPIIPGQIVNAISQFFKLLYHPKFLIFFILFSFLFFWYFYFFLFQTTDLTIYEDRKSVV